MDNEVSIETLASGAAIEMVNHALQMAYGNIQDPNTLAEQKREVVLRIGLIPNEDRDVIKTEIKVENKNAANRPATTKLLMSRGRDGVFNVEELGARQTTMDSFIDEGRRLVVEMDNVRALREAE